MIKRRLSIEANAGNERRIITEDEITAIGAPIVILGDPGAGKSFLTLALGEKQGLRYVRAGTFDRCAAPESLLGDNKRFVIDGLDEISSTSLGGGVDSVLRKLSSAGYPPFILSCRAADWFGAADRVKIYDDYGQEPTLLRLLPFNSDEATAFLLEGFPTVDAAATLAHLHRHGLEQIYGNPLTLKMLGTVAHELGELPRTRTELLERAGRLMLKEENRHHSSSGHATREDEDLLLAAGAICATLLLCDRMGVFAGPASDTPEDHVHVTAIVKLPFGHPTSDVLKTRLFQSEGEDRFFPVHRVFAEYFGAKWLARCFDSGVSERRIFGLVQQDDGVPTSLRGLHAWIAHFSDVLADRCIRADPYAVLRYGDVSKLSLSNVGILLDALERLSEEDPFFRAEDWNRQSATGLMRVELRERILGIITLGRSLHLNILLADALNGSQLANFAVPELRHLMLDVDRAFAERWHAAGALVKTGLVNDWDAVIAKLLGLGDSDSDRLAVELFTQVGAAKIPKDTCVEAVLANLEISLSRLPRNRSRNSRSLPKHLFDEIQQDRLLEILDSLAAYAGTLAEDANKFSVDELACFIAHLAARAIGADPGVLPTRVWNWINWLPPHRDASQKAELRDALQQNEILRSGLLELVLLTPCADSTWMGAFLLRGLRIGLWPTDDDLARLMVVINRTLPNDSKSEEMWRDLVHLGRLNGFEDGFKAVAIETANGDAERLKFIIEMSQVAPISDEGAAQHSAEVEAHRREIHESHRKHHREHAVEIAAGHPGHLHDAAMVYAGRYYEFEKTETPQERILAFLGQELAGKALDGFIATLSRGDVPSAKEIATARAKNRQLPAELPMICGICEMIRRGMVIDELPRDTRAAALMAWHSSAASKENCQVDVGATLESNLFDTEFAVESYFRAGIEPQLECATLHIIELDRLLHTPRWRVIAGRLAAEWLIQFPSSPLYVQNQLLSAALAKAPAEAKTAIIDSRSLVHADADEMYMWLSADYLVDFDNCKHYLVEVASEDPSFIWSIRDRTNSESWSSPKSAALSLNQLSFVVDLFSAKWPKAERPEGIMNGNKNASDASALIEGKIYAIANNPSSEATAILARLIVSADPSYLDDLRHALALQRKTRRDHEYVARTVGQLQAVMASDLPEKIDDMRAYFGDRLDTLQNRLRGNNTDMGIVYWNGAKPHIENDCRNRLIEQISGQLHQSIRFIPEMQMPDQTRADIAAIRASIGLPVEIKGQWHPEVWNAPVSQLDANYTRDWHAEGRGVYIVLWFGAVPGKNLPAHPEGLARPKTPDLLREMLINRLPEARRTQIDVFVLDVSRPDRTAEKRRSKKEEIAFAAKT